jgi:hypothetical protein
MSVIVDDFGYFLVQNPIAYNAQINAQSSFPDPPLVGGTDLDSDPDPDPSIIKQK